MAPAGCRRIWDHVRLLRRLVTSRWQLHALLWLLGLMALQLAGAEAAFGPWETKRLQATTKTADEQGGWSAKHRLPPASVIVDSAASVCCLCQRTTLCASRRAYRCSWLVSCMCVGGARSGNYSARSSPVMILLSFAEECLFWGRHGQQNKRMNCLFFLVVHLPGQFFELAICGPPAAPDFGQQKCMHYQTIAIEFDTIIAFNTIAS